MAWTTRATRTCRAAQQSVRSTSSTTSREVKSGEPDKVKTHQTQHIFAEELDAFVQQWRFEKLFYGQWCVAVSYYDELSSYHPEMYHHRHISDVSESQKASNTTYLLLCGRSRRVRCSAVAVRETVLRSVVSFFLRMNSLLTIMATTVTLQMSPNAHKHQTQQTFECGRSRRVVQRWRFEKLFDDQWCVFSYYDDELSSYHRNGGPPRTVTIHMSPISFSRKEMLEPTSDQAAVNIIRDNKDVSKTSMRPNISISRYEYYYYHIIVGVHMQQPAGRYLHALSSRWYVV